MLFATKVINYFENTYNISAKYTQMIVYEYQRDTSI